MLSDKQHLHDIGPILSTAQTAGNHPGFLTLCHLTAVLSSCQRAFTERLFNAQHRPRVADEVKALYLPMRSLWSWWGGQPTVPGKHHSSHKTMERRVSDCAPGARWCNQVPRPGEGEAGRGPSKGARRAAWRSQVGCFGPVLGASWFF